MPVIFLSPSFNIHHGQVVNQQIPRQALMQSISGIMTGNFNGAGYELSQLEHSVTSIENQQDTSSSAEPNPAYVPRAEHTGAKPSSSSLSGAEPNSASLSGAELTGAEPNSSSLSGAEITGAEHTGAEPNSLSGTKHTGAEHNYRSTAKLVWS